MKMPRSSGTWYYPKNTEDLLLLVTRHGPRGLIVAGGTDILPAMRNGKYAGYNAYFDITRIGALGRIEADDGFLRIGSAVTHTGICPNPLVRQYAPLLGRACAMVGSPQIRNRGTLGGNIITLSTCGDTIPALAAHDASLVFYGDGGKRIVELAEYLENEDLRYTRGREFLFEVKIPITGESGRYYCFDKIARRKAAAKARLSLACMVEIKDGIFTSARFAAGAVSPVPRRYRNAEVLLLGKKPSPELFAQAGDALAEGIVSVSGNYHSFDYKLPVIKDLVFRFLENSSSGKTGENRAEGNRG
jgi:CO/xanthine dehydrogenase FAD-binding subunit